jgi:hypothetical protein
MSMAWKCAVLPVTETLTKFFDADHLLSNFLRRRFDVVQRRSAAARRDMVLQ